MQGCVHIITTRAQGARLSPPARESTCSFHLSLTEALRRLFEAQMFYFKITV